MTNPHFPLSDAIMFKNESPFGGPVFVRRAGEVANYEDGDVSFLGRLRPKWFSRAQAEAIAEREGLPFQEV